MAVGRLEYVQKLFLWSSQLTLEGDLHFQAELLLNEILKEDIKDAGYVSAILIWFLSRLTCF